MSGVIGSEEIILKLIWIYEGAGGKSLGLMDFWREVATHLRQSPESEKYFLLAFGPPVDPAVIDIAFFVGVSGLGDDGKLVQHGLSLTDLGRAIADAIILPDNFRALEKRMIEFAKDNSGR